VNEYLYDKAKINSSIYFINLEIHDFIKNAYVVGDETFVVYEPDYLFDVTEIAECITLNGAYPSAFFLKLFSGVQNSIPLIKGTLVNSIFDEVIVNPIVDFQSVFHKAIKQRPIRLLPLLNKKISVEIMSDLQIHFDVISKNILDFPPGKQLIEPTFISGKYGLQGRLDLLIESNEDENRREVIELKSGKPPSSPIRFHYSKSSLFLNTWTSHTAQANGYNLLLESTFENRIGSSSIFYSLDSERGLRNVPNIFEIKNQFLEVRNKIYLDIQKLLENNDSIWNIISKNDLSDRLLLDAKTRLTAKIRGLSNLERHYYSEAIKFILREELSSKIGKGNGSSGQSALWNSSFEDKQDDFSVLTNLEIEDTTDFTYQHIQFKLNTEENDNTNFFRKGDQCLIYPKDVSENPTQFYILRGFIREIDSERILISLLNKSLDENIIKKYPFWNIEIDRSNSLTKKQYAFL
jgi:DNA replication ATP-dependent helicase Dna2